MKEISFSEICKVIDLTADTMDNFMYAVDFKNDCYHISKSALDRFALPSNTFDKVTLTHKAFVYPPDVDALLNELQELSLGNRTTHNMQYRWLAKDGVTPIWINCRGQIIQHNGENLFMVGCINEIGARQKADNISGLLRLGGESTLPEEIAKSDFKGFILRIGLDDIHGINANQGEHAGDTAISQTAECILSELSDNQYVYHINGAEFLILSLLSGNSRDAEQLFKRIRIQIDNKIKENNYSLVFSISGGIVTSEDIEDASFDSLMRASEFALSQAVSLGQNTHYQFDFNDYCRFVNNRNLSKLLRDSVSNKFAGFEAYYQILVGHGPKILGAETLMRFTGPDGHYISPADFIPVLEETGLIIPAGRWILDQALSTCAKVRKFEPEFTISVNVSYVQVMKTNFAKDVAYYLKKYQLPPSSLIIELTESGFLEGDNHYNKTWNHLRQMGVKLALDDFGTGYSNFHYLATLKPYVVKIDRSFIVNAINNPIEFSLLSNIRKMAETLSMNMCFEGIETEADLDKVKVLRPEYIQGYYFGKPEPEDALITRVELHDIHK